MDYGAFFVDETAAPVENAFLEFLRRYASLYLSILDIEFLHFGEFLYQIFLFCSFRTDPNSRNTFYESEVTIMEECESTTMFIDFSHVMRFDDVLQKAVSDEYLRYGVLSKLVISLGPGLTAAFLVQII